MDRGRRRFGPMLHRRKLKVTTDRAEARRAQQIAVLAEYSDGSVRDVSRQSGSRAIRCRRQRRSTGLVKSHQLSGDRPSWPGTWAMWPFSGFHGEPRGRSPVQADQLCRELSLAKWKAWPGPSPIVDDATFLRRITVDLCGRLPTPAEVKAFLADTSTDKRTKLADKLLDSPDYPAYFALRWGSILRNSNLAGADQAAYAFHGWIKDMIARNRPYDEFVRGIVAAAGEWQDAPAINWYWQNRDDQLHQITADVAQIFMGVRLQCAKCHHHPYERWGQGDYYGLAGFFTRLGRKSFGQPPPYYASATVTSGERDPLTGRHQSRSTPMAVTQVRRRTIHAMPSSTGCRSRTTLLLKGSRESPLGPFLGRGLYHEVDDQRDNPPSSPELPGRTRQDFLAKEVRREARDPHDRDEPGLSAEFDADRSEQGTTARTSPVTTPGECPPKCFSMPSIKRQDQKLASSGVGTNGQAVDLPHEGFGSYFLDTFDRPKRVTV